MPMGCPIIGGALYIRNNSINEKKKYQQLLVTHFLPKAKSPHMRKAEMGLYDSKGGAAF